MVISASSTPLSYVLYWQDMIDTQAPARQEDIGRILAELEPYPARRRRPAFIVLVGLPAAGKSRVAQELEARTGAVVLESDALRRLLFRRRTYSTAESQRLFAAIHGAAQELLEDGMSVVLDATNLNEEERTPLYEIAERTDAKLILVQVTAPESAIRRRLLRREAGGGNSEADADVYERMRDRAETMERPHYLVDTSQEIGPILTAITKEMMKL